MQETVPDTVLDRADEIILVDITPDELLARLKAGKVYLPQQAERAAQNFFRKGNLIALREIALRRTAEHVEDDVRSYRIEQSQSGTGQALTSAPAWNTSGAILVCVGPHEGAEHAVRSAARLAERKQRIKLAFEALERGLPEQFAGDEIATISTLLGIVGEDLNGGWAAQCGLGRDVSAQVLNRNLVAFQQAPEAARIRIVGAVDEMVRAFESRYAWDLDTDGAHAFAQILWSAEEVDYRALVWASGRLVPLLLRSTRQPVSSMIAATFPVVYRELAKHDNVPDMLKFIPFLDWDRCKAARRELVEAFVNSPVWRPDDLVLTACRCSDVERILMRTARSIKGDAYIDQLIAHLPRLPSQCRNQAESIIFKIRSEPTGTFSHRD